MTMPLEYLAARALVICEERNWGRSWDHGGCYLHLEVSEFIEALRGKKGTPEAEATDVLFVFLSMLRAHNIPVSEVLLLLEDKIKLLENKPR